MALRHECPTPKSGKSRLKTYMTLFLEGTSIGLHQKKKKELKKRAHDFSNMQTN
jgi:hypothetical protein